MHLKMVEAVLEPLLHLRRLATCAVVDLEMLFSTRSPIEYEAMLRHRQIEYTDLPITPEIAERAVEVQSQLAIRSQHRACGAPDLLIAACAEIHRVPLLHYDKDFDLISTVTGQATHWVVPRGQVP